MVGWNQQLNGHEFEQVHLGDGEGQGSLARCSPWGHKESDTTELLKNSNKHSRNLGGNKTFYNSTTLHTYILSTNGLNSSPDSQVNVKWSKLDHLKEYFVFIVHIPVILVSCIGMAEKNYSICVLMLMLVLMCWSL